MKTFNTQFRTDKTILALGAESAGNFSFYSKGKIYFSEDFGDLYDKKTFQNFQKAVLDFIAKNGKPGVIISDLHPLFNTTSWGKELSSELDAEFVQVQHHLAHIFSAVGDSIITQSCHFERSNSEVEESLSNERKGFLHLPLCGVGRNDKQEFIGIACDGTGYGFDEKIWGGEVFGFSKGKEKRVGRLENQILIGGELAIKEPARMLISILSKFLEKDEVYEFVKDFYSRNEFELLWNQRKEGFNCIETSSTGRVLDAVSVLLGFSGNERAYKHAPIDLLEKNSGKPYEIELPSLSPRALAEGSLSKNLQFPISNFQSNLNAQNSKIKTGLDSRLRGNDEAFVLQTTPLFEYLVKNIDKDKKRLAATAQMYLAKGLWEICLSPPCHPERKSRDPLVNRERDFSTCHSVKSVEMTIPIFFAGGVANNKIISDYLVSKGVIVSKEVPRGDEGISIGQLVYYLSGCQL